MLRKKDVQEAERVEAAVEEAVAEAEAKQPDIPADSVAVLPFRNMSGDTNNECDKPKVPAENLTGANVSFAATVVFPVHNNGCAPRSRVMTRSPGCKSSTLR